MRAPKASPLQNALLILLLTAASGTFVRSPAATARVVQNHESFRKKRKGKKKKSKQEASRLYIKPLSNVPKILILLASAKRYQITAAESWAGGEGAK